MTGFCKNGTIRPPEGELHRRNQPGYSRPMRLLLIASLAAPIACSSSSTGSSGFSGPCHIGELSGTWRVHYTQTDGNCGALPDETVIMDAAPSNSKCTYAAKSISADKCRMDLDFTCPLPAGPGEQHWVGTLRQTGPGSMDGPWTGQGTSLGQTCRSSYDVHWQQQ